MPYILLFIPLLIYAGLSAFILFHLKKYGIAGDSTKQIIVFFFVVSIVLIFFYIWAFLNIPWDKINLADMLQNATINDPYFYQQ